MTELEALAVLAAGAVAGAVNTVVGSGSLITFPTLLAVGYSPVTANVSNCVGLVPGGVAGSFGYRRELRGQWRRLGILAIGTTIGAAGLGVAATAGSTQVLFWALFVFGLGSAVVPIAGTGALFRAYPAARRGWAMGVRQTAVPFGGAIAAIVYPSLYALGGTGLTMSASAAVVAVRVSTDPA